MPTTERADELHQLIAPAAEIVRRICDASLHRGLPDLPSNAERSRLTLEVMKMLDGTAGNTASSTASSTMGGNADGSRSVAR